MLIGCLLAATLTSSLRAATPDVQLVLPRGVQRGTEADLLLQGARLDDAKEILFYSPGITVTSLDTKNPGQLKAHVQIAKDAHIGEYCLRVRSETGISELRTLYVGPYPIVEAKKPFGDFEHPQPIDLNVTVFGTVDNEQVHHFVVEAKKGQRLTAEVHGMRLGYLFDPYVAILDEKRFELAASDDTALAMQDPIASAIVPQDGKYIIQIRESSYGGNGASHYLLHVGTFPRPRIAYPLGGKAGEDLALQFIGDVAGPIAQTIKLPTESTASFELFPEQDGLIAPSPNRIAVSTFANVLEKEPNDDPKTATVAEGELPLALNGIIDHPGDIDFFRFKAKKGQALHIRVIARALRSPLDSVLALYNAQGGQMAANDDAGSPDSYLRFDPPADGEYIVSVTDHLKAGGPEYAYRVEITPIKPALTFTIPQYSQNSQERWTVPVPRGNRYATLLRASRADFGGPLALSSPDLPEGVTLATDDFASDVVPVVFEAKADAPIGGKLSALEGKSADGKTDVQGRYEQKVELVIGNNNQAMYWSTIDKLAVAVTKEAPFKLHLEQPKVPLVQGGSMELKVSAERAPDFKAPISVRLLFNPPGIGAASAVDMPGDKSEVMYPLNAEPGAGLKKWKICVVGMADVKGQLWVSSELVDLEIASPYLLASIQMTAAEQGKPAAVLCKLDQKLPFEGKAKVKLLGLPPNATAQEMEIAAADKEVTVPVTVDAKTPVGTHQTLFCRVVVMKDGVEIVHNLARGGVLRVDAPPPPKKDAPPPPVQTAAKPPEKAPEAPKPLSRLEKLRQEQGQK
ncbi:MAG: peptidase [Phycisphaerales bacterium]|nr:peptidase [Phycisphaerales bacterium]